MGNLHSVSKALSKVGAEVSITNDPATIEQADKLVFPGVGAMRDCMGQMHAEGIDAVVKRRYLTNPSWRFALACKPCLSEAMKIVG